MATTGQVNKGEEAYGVQLYVSDAALGAGTVTSGDISGVDGYAWAEVEVVATISGTTTLDVYLQKRLADGATYTDIAHFTQLAATGKLYLTLGNQAFKDAAVQDAALAANSIATTHMGTTWRVKAVVAGAAPSAQFTVWGSFFRSR